MLSFSVFPALEKWNRSNSLELVIGKSTCVTLVALPALKGGEVVIIRVPSENLRAVSQKLDLGPG